jgi:hypothetical protein
VTFDTSLRSEFTSRRCDKLNRQNSRGKPIKKSGVKYIRQLESCFKRSDEEMLTVWRSINHKVIILVIGIG